MAQYNALTKLPHIPYNIMYYLATSPQAEDLWKMLKYADYDALSKTNLTLSEKLDMVWKSGKQEDYSVFFTNLVEDAIPESRSILKIYNFYVQPKELYTSVVVYAFDFLFGGQMSLVDYNGYPVNRGDLATSILCSCLNGTTVGGVGKMAFLDNMSRYDLAKSVIGNSKTFTGVCVYMSTNVGDGGTENGCID